MAVINSPQIGIARGKLGDAVYYRSKGNTNARSYNPNTTNRRTVRQQAQRSMFSSAVKFFSRGIQNLFVFAYEDKRTQESDYNAFMRYNTKRGMYFGPAQNEDPDYPALGEFILTQGSLPAVQQLDENSHIAGIIPVSVENIRFETVAELSEALIMNSQDYQNGDIITFLQIVTPHRQGSPSEPVILQPGNVSWKLRQLILDVADNRTLTSLNIEAYGRNSTVIVIEHLDLEYVNNLIQAYAVIHSRQVGGNLKVSDCTLSLSGAASLALQFGRSDTWKAIVDSEWGTEQLSILQGGIASRQQREIVPTITNAFALPILWADINGKYSILSGIWTVQELVAHLKVVVYESTIMSVNYVANRLDFSDGADIILQANVTQTETNTVLEWIDVVTADEEVVAIYWD